MRAQKFGNTYVQLNDDEVLVRIPRSELAVALHILTIVRDTGEIREEMVNHQVHRSALGRLITRLTNVAREQLGFE